MKLCDTCGSDVGNPAGQMLCGTCYKNATGRADVENRLEIAEGHLAALREMVDKETNDTDLFERRLSERLWMVLGQLHGAIRKATDR